MLRDVTGAGRRQLVDVDEETLLSIARIEGEHPMVDVLLDALAPVARSQSPAGRSSVEAGFNPLGLRVVVDVLDDDAPLSVHIAGADRASVENVTGADVALISNPVALIEWISVVERVVEVVLFDIGDTVDQVVSGLISNFGVLLDDQRIVLDGVLFYKTPHFNSFNYIIVVIIVYLDLLFGIFVILEAESSIGAVDALGW